MLFSGNLTVLNLVYSTRQTVVFQEVAMFRKSLLFLSLSLVIALSVVMSSCSNPVGSVGEKLARFRQGTWFSGSGTYTVWTDRHYFVISYEGDSTRANIYCGVSQVEYFDQGTARGQTLRIRKFSSGDIKLSRDNGLLVDSSEVRLAFDNSKFAPETCVLDNGILYDAIIEQNDDYILLASCNGDREKIYADGVAVYLPAGGGEYYSYRIDTFE